MNIPFWFSAVKDFHKTKTLYILLSGMIAVGLYVAAIIYFEEIILKTGFKPNPMIFSLLGLALSLMLVFRTNTAYDRWWEGRRMLGSLVNNTRNLALKLNVYLDKNDHESRAYFIKMIGNYGIAMKEHLRFGVKFDELRDLSESEMADLQKYTHVPNRIAHHIYTKINELYINKNLTNEQFLVIDKHIESFTDVIGACERIKNTPIPFSYSVHLKKFIFFYILILPFSVVTDLRFWSIPIMMLVFYAFTGLEVIGEEIEDPFGTDVNDLQTDSITQKIYANMEELLGNK